MAQTGESAFDKATRVLSYGAALTGIGIGVHQGWGNFTRPIQTAQEGMAAATVRAKAANSLQGVIAPGLLSKDIEAELAAAFSKGRELLGGRGWKETLTRTLDEALYSAGIAKEAQRTRLVEELSQFTGWNEFKRAFENAIGAGTMENLQRSMRDIFRKNGGRSETLSDMITNTASYHQTKSDFRRGGGFWKALYPTPHLEDNLAGVRSLSLDPRFAEIQRKLEEATGDTVDLGFRTRNRPHLFNKGNAALFEVNIPGKGKMKLPFVEAKLGDDRTFLKIPLVHKALEKKGMGYAIESYQGMSFSSLPHMTIQDSGGNVKVLNFNESIDILLNGDPYEKRFKGLYQILRENKEDKGAIIRGFNELIQGLGQRVHSTFSKDPRAIMGSNQAVPIERLLSEVAGEKKRGVVSELLEYMTGVKKATGEVAGATSASTMQETYRVSLKDWAKRTDIFGAEYPISRRYSSMFREFDLSEKGKAWAQKNKILGFLDRFRPVTATREYYDLAGNIPQGFGLITINQNIREGQGWKSLLEDEGLFSKKISPILERITEEVHTLRKSTLRVKKGDIFTHREMFGQDYKSGEAIYSSAQEGKVTQKILKLTGNEDSDLVSALVETIIAPQSASKQYGWLKTQWHRARGSFRKNLISETGIDLSRGALSRFGTKIEFAAQSAQMKGGIAGINKQMSEALLALGENRLNSLPRNQRAGKTTKGKTFGKLYGSLSDYTFREDSRQEMIIKWKNEGKALAKNVASHIDENYGFGLRSLQAAKDMGIRGENLGLMGGAYYQELLKGVQGDTNEAARILGEIGLEARDIKGLQEAKAVLGMNTFHLGDWASYQKWQGVSLDARAISRLMANPIFGEAGEYMARELLLAQKPMQDFGELSTALKSLIGEAPDIPDNLDVLDSPWEAKQRVGKKAFIFKYGEEQIYVPGPQAKQMGDFVSDIGDVHSQKLKTSYEKFFQKVRKVSSGEKEAEPLALAVRTLKEEVFNEWMHSVSTGGELVGGVAPMAASWMSKPGEAAASRTYKNIGEFLADEKDAFTIGLSKKNIQKAYKEAIEKAATPEQTAFMKKQMEKLLAGEQVNTILYRHPTMYPESTLPARLRMVSNTSDSVFLRKTTLHHRGERLDNILAAAINADTDGDRLQVKVIMNEMTDSALDKLLRSRKYGEDFVKSAMFHKEIADQVKSFAKGKTGLVEDFEQGMIAMVAAKFETGKVSTAAGELFAAAKLGGATQEELLPVMHALSRIEESPISGKKGLWGGNEVADHLKDFTRGGESTAVGSSLEKVYDMIYGGQTMGKKGEIIETKEAFINKMKDYVKKAHDNGSLEQWRKTEQTFQRSRKNYIKINGDIDRQIRDIFHTVDRGLGDIYGGVVASVRGGRAGHPQALQERTVLNAATGLGEAALKIVKNHWKYPLAGIAAGVAISGLGSLVGGNEINFEKDASDKATQGLIDTFVPRVNPPPSYTNRIVTMGGGNMPEGWESSIERDYTSAGVRQLMNFGAEVGAQIRLRDDRGAITPQYIQKAMRDRYY